MNGARRTIRPRRSNRIRRAWAAVPAPPAAPQGARRQWAARAERAGTPAARRPPSAMTPSRQWPARQHQPPCPGAGAVVAGAAAVMVHDGMGVRARRGRRRVQAAGHRRPVPGKAQQQDRNQQQMTKQSGQRGKLATRMGTLSATIAAVSWRSPSRRRIGAPASARQSAPRAATGPR